MRRSRPRLRSLAIALLLGLVTNVLVTAWCVYAAGIGPRQHVVTWDHGRGVTQVVIFSGPAKEIVMWDAGEPMTLAEYRATLGYGGIDGVGTRPPGWSTVHSQEWVRVLADDRGNMIRTDIAYGWPRLSFRGGWCSLVSAAPGTPDQVLDFGPALPEMVTTVTNAGGTTTSREPRAVVLMPIASGMALNSGLYGALWWAALFAPGRIRRWTRRRRGACLECGYDRRGIAANAVCPECGLNEPSARAESLASVANDVG